MARGLACGDIRLLEFGPPDKVRPALLITRTSAMPYLHAITVVPITRTIRGIPTELLLGVEEGMKEPCAATFDQVQTVPKAQIGRYLGSLDSGRTVELKAALLFAYGLE